MSLRQQTRQRLKGIGRKIKETRLESNLLQKKLAELSGISVNYLCLVEAGKRTPSYWTVERISDVLKIGIRELIGKTEAIMPRKILKKELKKLEKLSSLFQNIDFEKLRRDLFC